MHYIDTDNAMGSRSGDIDDGFALIALLLSKLPLLAIGSVRGNTDECSAHKNNEKLLELCKASVLNLRSHEVSGLLNREKQTLNVMALGPLTNIAPLVERDLVSQVVVVGGNSNSIGKIPPIWPYEFNLVKDRNATLKVFRSSVDLKLIPLNVARRFQVSWKQLETLPGTIGEYLRQHSRRWFQRARWLKASRTVPLWDLVAAFYVIDSKLFTTKKVRITIHSNTWIEWGKGNRTIEVVQDFEPKALWSKFERLVAGNG